MMNRKVLHRPSVDQRGVGLFCQAIDRAAHGHPGRLKNVDPVDLIHLDHRAAPEHGTALREFVVDALALPAIELLRVVEHRVIKTIGQNGRRRAHGPGQRPSPHFVNTGDDEIARCAEIALVMHRRSVHGETRIFGALFRTPM